MGEPLKDRLRIVVSVALAVIPRYVRRDYLDKLALTSDPARQKIAEAVAEAVQQVFEVKEKPPQIGHP